MFGPDSSKEGFEDLPIVIDKFKADKSTNELINDLKKILNKKPIIICLDEADKLENNDILYFILEDLYKKTLILITNERSWLDELDKRVRSRLYA